MYIYDLKWNYLHKKFNDLSQINGAFITFLHIEGNLLIDLDLTLAEKGRRPH